MLISILEIFEREEMKAPRSFNFILCGGAKVSEELIIRAKMSNIKILPTYGMTETTSQIATAAPKDNNRPSGSVGKLLDKMQIKFSEKNEILVKGPNVAKYYESEPTEWLETGDFGYIDASKYLFDFTESTFAFKKFKLELSKELIINFSLFKINSSIISYNLEIE